MCIVSIHFFNHNDFLLIKFNKESNRKCKVNMHNTLHTSCLAFEAKTPVLQVQSSTVGLISVDLQVMPSCHENVGNILLLLMANLNKSEQENYKCQLIIISKGNIFSITFFL